VRLIGFAVIHIVQNIMWMDHLKRIKTACVGNGRAKLMLGLNGKKTWAATARIRTSRKIENGENTEYREY